MKLNKAVLLGTYILIIIVTIGIIFISFSKRSAKHLSAPTITPTVQPDNTNIVDTSDWKTYTDLSNGFSFRYPADFKFSNYSEGKLKGISLVLIGPTQMASGRTQSSLAEGAIFKSLVIPNSQATEEAQLQYTRETTVPPGEPTPNVSPIKKIMLAGKDAYQYKIQGMGNAKATFLQLNSSVLEIITIFQGFSQDEEKYYENLTDQIISGIKILDISSPTPTCIPRPKCLDETPRCLIPETEDMCPPAIGVE